MRQMKSTASGSYQRREAIISVIFLIAITATMWVTFHIIKSWSLEDAEITTARKTWEALNFGQRVDEWLWLERNWVIGVLAALGFLMASALFEWIPQKIRGGAVAFYFIVSCAAPLKLIRGSRVGGENLPEDILAFPRPDGPFSLRLWMVISALQILACTWFAWTHIRHIRRDSLKYFHHFRSLSSQNFADDPDGGTSRDDAQLKVLHKGKLEGESTLLLLLVVIYGIVALSAVTITYFIIGERLRLVGDEIPFIFKNNEGFTAALSLLIIVLTSAAVPIYSDLVKKIDEEINSFEQDISILTQNLNGLSIGADAMWKHFTDVGLPLFEEWRQSFRDTQARSPNFLAEAHFDQLFLPYLIYQTSLHEAGGSFDRYPPRLLDPFVSLVKELRAEGTALDSLFQGSYNATRTRLSDGSERNFQLPDSEHSRRRVHTWVTDWYLDGEDIADLELDESQQVSRARALKFLAFRLQGAGAIAGWSTRDGRFQEFYRCEDQNELAFAGSDRFIPSSEHIIYALEESHPSGLLKPDGTTPDSLANFRTRVARHLSDIVKAEGNFSSADRLNRLIQISDKLDLDASVFWDDVVLFQQFVWASHNVVERPDALTAMHAALSRFLYYVIWYFSSFNPATKIGNLLMIDTPEGVEANADTAAPVSSTEIQQRLEKLHTRLRSRDFDGDSEAKRFVSLLLADRRSALHNWLRASQAHRSRRVLCQFEAKLDEIAIPRQLGVPIIPSHAQRLSHLRYIVRSPQSLPARHALRLVSSFDLPPDSISKARKTAMAADFDRRLISVQFKQLREHLKFSKTWVEDTGIAKATLELFLEAKRNNRRIEIQLPPRLRTFLVWICRVQGQVVPEHHFDLLDLGLRNVSHRYSVVFAQDGVPDANWQAEQWGQFYAYCANPENHEAIRGEFFGGAGGQGPFENWRNYSRSRFTLHGRYIPPPPD